MHDPALTDPASTDDDLIALARAAAGGSYAPYSKFESGAVVVGVGGQTSIGVIVENVSLGLAMCAERVAMFGLVGRGDRPAHLALAAPDTRGSLTWPCGACLQVALELGGPEMVVTVGDDGAGPTSTTTVADLLPRGPKAA